MRNIFQLSVAKPHKPWKVFAAQCLLVLLVIIAGGRWFMNRYAVVVAHGKPCLPGKVYLVEKQQRQVSRGELVAFRIDDRPQPYVPGTKFVKLVAGMPGDVVEVDSRCRLMLSGPDGFEYHADLESAVVSMLHKECRDFNTQYQIPKGHYFVIGTLPDSYDSRYWGLVSQEQIIGRAARLF